MSFVGVLGSVGKEFGKGLRGAVAYTVPAERLIGLLFPALQPATAGLAEATSLIQNAVLVVEQKFAAHGAQSGTGAEKQAEVMALIEQAATALLEKAGVTVSSRYLENLITAVVSILNVQQMPTAG